MAPIMEATMVAPDDEPHAKNRRIPPIRPKERTEWERKKSEPRSHQAMAWVFGSIFLVIFLLALAAIVGLISVPFPSL